MNVLQAVLTGVFVSVTLAFVSGLLYMLLKERFERTPIRETEKTPQAHSYMEVWQCPHCRRLSRIARQCKWCLKDMPLHPRFLTVPEKQYTDQLLLPGTPVKRDSSDDAHSV